MPDRILEAREKDQQQSTVQCRKPELLSADDAGFE